MFFTRVWSYGLFRIPAQKVALFEKNHLYYKSLNSVIAFHNGLAAVAAFDLSTKIIF